MRLALRIILPLLAVLSIIAWATTPLVGVLMERWFRSDVGVRDLFERTLDHRRSWVRSLSIPFEWQDAVIRAASPYPPQRRQAPSRPSRTCSARARMMAARRRT